MQKQAIYEDGSYLDRNPGWHEEDAPWKAEQIHKILERNSIRPQSICEVGCGSGEILRSLQRHFAGASFTGYDISPQAFEICNKKTSGNLRFFLGDFLAMKTGPFDVSMAIDVFEHVEDYYGFLRAMKGKSEYKVFHIPLDLSVQTVLRSSPILRCRSAVGHLHYFTKETALASLVDTGYEIIDHNYTSGALELANRGWKSDLLKIPRRAAFALDQDLAVRVLGGFSLLVLAR